MSRQIDKLNRFCLQTEQAMTHLQGLRIIADSEAEVLAMKTKLKKEKAQANKLKIGNDWGDPTVAPGSLANGL